MDLCDTDTEYPISNGDWELIVDALNSTYTQVSIFSIQQGNVAKLFIKDLGKILPVKL